MFIKTNDRVINLQNVSNINFIKNTYRIVFNMNYNIEINSKGNYKLISDYVYWDLINENQYLDAIRSIENDYYSSNFVRNVNSAVNINEISSVKFSDKKSRIIINLSHPVTFTDYNGNDNITSEFVYWNFKSFDEYLEASKNFKLTLCKGI